MKTTSDDVAKSIAHTTPHDVAALLRIAERASVDSSEQIACLVTAAVVICPERGMDPKEFGLYASMVAFVYSRQPKSVLAEFRVERS